MAATGDEDPDPRTRIPTILTEPDPEAYRPNEFLDNVGPEIDDFPKYVQVRPRKKHRSLQPTRSLALTPTVGGH